MAFRFDKLTIKAQEAIAACKVMPRNEAIRRWIHSICSPRYWPRRTGW